MPKDTYFHLSEEKQRRIMQAAREEVIRVPFSKVSINRIIQKAEISRGSFYQYFEDKEDLIFFVLEGHICYIKNMFQTFIRECGGNIFAAADRILEGVFLLGEDPQYGYALRSVLVEGSSMECSFRYLHCVQNELVDILKEEMDCSMLKMKTEDEYRHFVKILFMIIRDVAVSYLYEKEDTEKYRESFAVQTAILKAGVLREE